MIGDDPDAMIEDLAFRQRAVEIEEAVVGEIDDGRTIGRRLERQRQLSRAGDAISHAHIEPAGKAPSPSALV